MSGHGHENEEFEDQSLDISAGPTPGAPRFLHLGGGGTSLKISIFCMKLEEFPVF